MLAGMCFSGPLLLHRFLLEDTACKLAVVQIGIEAILREQFLVSTFFYDAAMIHDEDQLGVPNRGESVGDDKTRPALHQLGHGSLDLHVGSSIDTAGRFVHNQDLGTYLERSA